MDLRTTGNAVSRRSVHGRQRRQASELSVRDVDGRDTETDAGAWQTRGI